jgi:hypothetical protein
VASDVGSSVSSGTRLASGSSSVDAFSSVRIDGSAVVGSDKVAASPTIVVGTKKLTQIPRKKATGRTRCAGLWNLIEARYQSVLCEEYLMFCEARVSMDFAHVKELLGEGSPSIGIREARCSCLHAQFESGLMPGSNVLNSLKTCVTLGSLP